MHSVCFEQTTTFSTCAPDIFIFKVIHLRLIFTADPTFVPDVKLCPIVASNDTNQHLYSPAFFLMQTKIYGTLVMVQIHIKGQSTLRFGHMQSLQFNNKKTLATIWKCKAPKFLCSCIRSGKAKV